LRVIVQLSTHAEYIGDNVKPYVQCTE